MNLLVICPARFLCAFTGDCTQARNTITELRKLVDKLTVIYAGDGVCFDENKNPLGEAEMDALFAGHDVAHLFTLPSKGMQKALVGYIDRLPMFLSTVFWNDWTRLRVSWTSRKSLPRFIVAAMRHIRTSLFKRNYPWCRVILPNSSSESENFLRSFRIAPDGMAFPIPNAINPPYVREEIDSLPFPEEIPFHDYVVCPGVFAPRKNQLSLIRAVRRFNFSFPIVFVGKAIEDAEWYERKCRSEASSKMFFAGYHDSNGETYWRILRHARCAILTSDCETPGIAMLEATYAGTRPVITSHGGTREYYGMIAEYLEPTSGSSIVEALQRALGRGRLTDVERTCMPHFSWSHAARMTFDAYNNVLQKEK